MSNPRQRFVELVHDEVVRSKETDAVKIADAVWTRIDPGDLPRGAEQLIGSAVLIAVDVVLRDMRVWRNPPSMRETRNP